MFYFLSILFLRTSLASGHRAPESHHSESGAIHLHGIPTPVVKQRANYF
jgi:hypothetical protein